jgi:hypothetical protein
MVKWNSKGKVMMVRQIVRVYRTELHFSVHSRQ